MSAFPAPSAFGAGIACFLAFVVVHIGGWRVGWNNARMLLLGFPLSLAGSAATATFLTAGSDSILSIMLSVSISILVYSSLFVLYVPAVYTVLTSLSVQTIMRLRLAEGSIPETDLYQRFASPAIIEDRIATLATHGYIRCEGALLRLTPQGRLIAANFAFIKRLWRLGAGG